MSIRHISSAYFAGQAIQLKGETNLLFAIKLTLNTEHLRNVTSVNVQKQTCINLLLEATCLSNPVRLVVDLFRENQTFLKTFAM